MSFEDIAKRMQKRDAILHGRNAQIKSLAVPGPDARRSVWKAYALMSLGIVMVLAGFMALVICAFDVSSSRELKLLIVPLVLGMALIKRAWAIHPSDQPNQ